LFDAIIWREGSILIIGDLVVWYATLFEKQNGVASTVFGANAKRW
jgi:hypothetical protein